MSDLSFQSLLTEGNLELPHVSQLLARMALAALLGSAIAYRVWRNTVDPRAACDSICALLPGTRMLEVGAVGADLGGADLGKDSGKLVLEVGLRGELDAAKILRMFEDRGVPGVRRVTLPREDS